jgi:hypothetical protein
VFEIRNTDKRSSDEYILYKHKETVDGMYHCIDKQGRLAIIRPDISEKRELTFKVVECNGIKYKPWPVSVKFWEPGDSESMFEPYAEIVASGIDEHAEGCSIKIIYVKVKGKYIPCMSAFIEGGRACIDLPQIVSWMKSNLPQYIQEQQHAK